ncbi:unnamed protein product [Rotaria sp. Silwood1]|nr:unnamed protein product [Rotaria sp. Silwood1]
MGEGKTSVILSILREILANGKQTVRINCLESLMGNMQELLRNKFSDDFQFLDILDETDEILCHGKELNNTLGSSKPLDGGPIRWGLPFLFFNMIFNEEQFCEKLKVASQLNNCPVVFQENFRPISEIGGGSSLVRFCKI